MKDEISKNINLLFILKIDVDKICFELFLDFNFIDI
jgi:hypothetical protein